MRRSIQHVCKAVIGFCVIGIGIGQWSISNAEMLLYESVNLAGHAVSPECFPVTCPDPQPVCDADDVGITSEADHGTVISNVVPEQGVFVNAIGYKNFIEVFPDGTPIVLGTYKYTGVVKLLATPKPDINQVDNPENVHMMIQLYDGRNALWTPDKRTLEGTIYWDLNPWTDDGQAGTLKIYIDSQPDPMNTGKTLLPDRNEHTFELIVDFANKKYVSMTVDGTTTDLSMYGLHQRTHADWENHVALSITTESEAANPQNETGCSTFRWETAFKNLQFFALPSSYLLWTK